MLVQKRRTCLCKPEIFVDNIIIHYNYTTWFSLYCYNLISEFYTCTTWNLCWLTSLSTTHAQPNFHCIYKTWYKLSTLAQPEIFIFMVKWHILCYTCTPWFSLHLQNMISVACNSYWVCMFSCIYTSLRPWYIFAVNILWVIMKKSLSL